MSVRSFVDPTTATERWAAMTWTQRLKRRFNNNIETCQTCGEAVRISAYLEDLSAIEKILTHTRAATS